MTTMVLHGSARIGGATDSLAAKFLEGLGTDPASVRRFRPSEMRIAHCRACGSCASGSGCVLDDDMRAVYPALKEAGVVVLAAPIFWGYMVELMTRITKAFGSSLSWMGAKTYDDATDRDIPIAELPAELEEAFGLGLALRGR